MGLSYLQEQTLRSTWMRSAPLSAKGKCSPPYSLVLQQPDLLSELLLCFHFWGRRRRRVSAAWGFLAYGTASGFESLCMGSRNPLSAPKEKGEHSPASELLGGQEDKGLSPHVSKPCIREIILREMISCHTWTCMSFLTDDQSCS